MRTPIAAAALMFHGEPAWLMDIRALPSDQDHVVTLFAPECGECVHCRSPRTNRCVAIREQQLLESLKCSKNRSRFHLH